MELMK